MDNIDFQLCDLAMSERLKKAGFNYPCRQYWRIHTISKAMVEEEGGSLDRNDDSEFEDKISRPTVALALRWLRQEKKIHIAVLPRLYSFGWYVSEFNMHVRGSNSEIGSYDSHDEAELAGLDEGLNLHAFNLIRNKK